MNDSTQCLCCGNTVQNRWLNSDGYTWHCKCGWAKRVWVCSKNEMEMLCALLGKEVAA